MVANLSFSLAVLTLFSCDSAFIVDSDGNIEVAISTRGPDPDPDGYSLTVDGSQAYFLPAAGSLVLQLQKGNHTVQLGGLADNCAVEGSNPRTVVVSSGGGAVNVTFGVVCVMATTGGFKIVVSTRGNSPDPDGYSLSVAGGETRRIGTQATENYLGLAAGRHLITLKDLAEGCSVSGSNPRLTTVVAGKSVTVNITVLCGVDDNPV
ncbi:MAG TPA: hypothetical protein VIG08_08320 [Gemmatimonadales bacterium]|jgi:hypothetical protein